MASPRFDANARPGSTSGVNRFTGAGMRSRKNEYLRRGATEEDWENLKQSSVKTREGT